MEWGCSLAPIMQRLAYHTPGRLIVSSRFFEIEGKSTRLAELGWMRGLTYTGCMARRVGGNPSRVGGNPRVPSPTTSSPSIAICCCVLIVPLRAVVPRADMGCEVTLRCVYLSCMSPGTHPHLVQHRARSVILRLLPFGSADRNSARTHRMFHCVCVCIRSQWRKPRVAVPACRGVLSSVFVRRVRTGRPLQRPRCHQSIQLVGHEQETFVLQGGGREPQHQG